MQILCHTSKSFDIVYDICYINLIMHLIFTKESMLSIVTIHIFMIFLKKNLSTYDQFLALNRKYTF